MSEIISKKGYNYTFTPSICNSCDGNCCIGESGYIWINAVEMEKLAFFLHISVEELKAKHLFKKNYKYSIKEVKLSENNFACHFFDTQKRQCSIYEARPSQCRTFPFWEYFKNNEEEVYKECPAVKSI